MVERVFSRRDLLRASLVGAAVAAGPVLPVEAIVPVEAIAPAPHPHSPEEQGSAQGPAPARERFETLTAAESDTLEAIVARLVPTDASGSGATEARAAHYIDIALGGALASSREAYTAGLAAVDAYSTSAKGASFHRLSAEDQDAVLTDMEQNRATGFRPGSAAFFGLLRTHTIQGMFCDPHYGGNANFVGWDLLGYPGVRTMVTAEQQRMGLEFAPNHKSAYDYDMFTKASAQTSK